MPWQSPGNYTPSDRLHSDDLNKLHQDDVTWGGDVNGGGYTLSNVVLEGVTGLAGGSAVTSVFTRTGDVIAVAGDYSAFYVPLARQVIAGAGMSGGGALSGDITLTALVTSVFGRTGAVVLTSADINSAGGALVTRNINTSTGLTGGGNLTTDRTLSVIPDSTNQQVQGLAAGTLVGTRHAINFINGANVTVGVVDNASSNRLDVTISSTGGSGGMVDPTTTKGDVIVRGLTVPNRLAVGADGQVLTADSTQAVGVKWATPSGGGAVTSVFSRTGVVVAANGDYTASQVTNAVDSTVSYNNPPWIASLPWAKITNAPLFMLDPTLAAGDLIVHGATTTRLPVGADGSILTADSTQAAGMRWGAVTVTSVFGRAGAVVAVAGDYTAAMVTGAVATTRNINTSTGLTGGGNLSADRTLSVVADSTNQQVQILLGGTTIGTRHAINFIDGANVALSIADDPTNNRINLTVSSSGTGSGLVDPTTNTGDLIVRGASTVQRLGVGANGQVLTADNTQLLGVKWATPTGGGAGSQTPWLSNIDGGGFSLGNVTGIGVNAASASGVARVLVEPTAAEEGVKTVINAAPALASMSVVNDIGDYLRMRSYGTGYVPTPPDAGLTTLESSTALALFASASEVMRLVAGHVLIGTTVDDGTHMLQVNGGVKSGLGGFTFPDGTTQTTAYTSASSPVTSVFGRTGAVVALAGDYTAAKVTNAVDQTGAYANPAWITSLAWSKITGAPAAAAQSPWTSDIDAATFKLKNVGRIGVANDASVVPDPSTAAPHLIVGYTALNSLIGEATVCTNTITLGAQVGNFVFANYGITATDKRIAAISALLDGAANSGAMTFFTWSAGAAAERMRITAAGNVGIGTSAPTSLLTLSQAGSAIDYLRLLNPSSPGNNGWALRIRDLVEGDFGIRDLTANVYRLYINAAGNVGIGTTTPTYPLTVNGAIRLMTSGTGAGIWHDSNAGTAAQVFVGMDSSSTLAWRLYSVALTANALIVDLTTGSVGIRTYPVEPLHVYGTSQSPSTAAGVFQGLAFFSGTVAVGLEIGSMAASPYSTWMQCRHSTAAAIYGLALQPLGGNVGIGVTSPRSPLSILTSNPTSAATAIQLTICEQSNNPQYQLSLGYFLNGGTGIYSGAIQSLHANAGSTLYLNNAGGTVNVGAQLTVGAGAVGSSAGDMSVGRTAAPTTGLIGFGNNTGVYLYFDGSSFNFTNQVTVATYLQVNGGQGISGNLTASGIIYGGSGTLNIPCLSCPPYSSNPVNMFANTLGFTINEAGNYVTLWVKMSNGTLHIASFTLTTPSFASDKAE